MATLDWTTRRSDGVTLVELVVTSEQPQRVRVESALTPVWPPRRQGVPEPGWDGPVVEGVVDDPLVVGYATPADPVDPPATVTSEPVAEDDLSPRAVVRALGDAAPPRDALPGADPPGAAGRQSTPETAVDDRKEDGTQSDDGPAGFEWGPDRTEPSGGEPSDTEPSETEPLAAVERRLSALEDRLDAVEASGRR